MKRLLEVIFIPVTRYPIINITSGTLSRQQKGSHSSDTSDWRECQRAVSICPRLHISLQCACPASEALLPINTRPKIALFV